MGAPNQGRIFLRTRMYVCSRSPEIAFCYFSGTDRLGSNGPPFMLKLEQGYARVTELGAFSKAEPLGDQERREQLPTLSFDPIDPCRT